MNLNSIGASSTPSQDPLAYMTAKVSDEIASEEKADLDFNNPDGDPQPEVKAEKEPKVEATPKATEALDKARTAVTRKYGAALTESLNDEQITAMSIQLAADLKNYNDAANKLDRRNADDVQDRHEDASEQEQEGDALRPSAEAKASELDDILGPLDSDLFGEELPEAFKGLADHFKTKLDAATAENRTLQMELVDSQVKRDLEDRFPSVRDPETSASVREKMQVLEPGLAKRESEDIVSYRTRLMEHALVLVAPGKVMESHGKSSQETGGPRPPKRRGEVATTPTDPNETLIQYQRLRFGSKPVSVAEAKRRAGTKSER